MDITTRPIKSVAALKKACYGQNREFCIALKGGMYSRKYIFYNHILNRFDVENCIDDTTQRKLSEAELREFTNIVDAMKQGHFYQIMDYDCSDEQEEPAGYAGKDTVC